MDFSYFCFTFDRGQTYILETSKQAFIRARGSLNKDIVLRNF